MLIQVKKLDYSTPVAYAPRQVYALLNLDAVVSAAPVEERGSGPFLRVTLSEGQPWAIVGTPETLLTAAKAARGGVEQVAIEDLRSALKDAAGYLCRRLAHLKAPSLNWSGEMEEAESLLMIIEELIGEES